MNKSCLTLSCLKVQAAYACVTVKVSKDSSNETFKYNWEMRLSVKEI